MGIDLSPYLVEMAGQLALEEGLGDRVTFRVGDTRALDVSDHSFDAVIAHTLVSHVLDPLAILEEVARVLKPTGLTTVVFHAAKASVWKALQESYRSAGLEVVAEVDVALEDPRYATAAASSRAPTTSSSRAAAASAPRRRRCPRVRAPP